MPRRLSEDFIRQQFDLYGYRILDQNFVYRNNKQQILVEDMTDGSVEHWTYERLKRAISRYTRTHRYVYFENNLLDLPLFGLPTQRSSFHRWLAKQPQEIQDLGEPFQRIAFASYQQYMRSLAHNQNTRIVINDNNQLARVYGLIGALKNADYVNYDIRLSIYGDDLDRAVYTHVNANTINLINRAFFDVQDIHDSEENIVQALPDVRQIDIEFIPINNPERRNGGFFPWTNKNVQIDLSEFGIYHNEEDIINEPCLVTAFRSSKLFTDDEIKLLASMIQTRVVLQSTLKYIARIFKVFINIKVVTDYETGKTSHNDYGDPNDKHLQLILMFNHYMLFKSVQTPWKKQKMPLFKVIKKLHDDNQLVPLSKSITNELIKNMQRVSSNDIDCDLCYRPLIVNDVKQIPTNVRLNRTERFFGYVPNQSEVDERIDELQNAINELPLRHPINVRNYLRFADIGQKILFETGCYDGVYQLTGKRALEIRESLVFPKTQIIGNNKLYLKGKYYYLDINAAYMNFVRSIPSGIDDGFTNDKVKDIIESLYQLRLEAKAQGKNKLATTLKFIMNSTWGYSIQRPRVIKHKRVKNVDTYVKRFASFILKQDGNYVDRVKCFVPHFTFPQFAKSVLDEYNAFFSNVKSMINVYYENIDAILTDEEGYNKLCSLGLVDDIQMGKFKIDKVFTEFAAISNKRYVGTLDNNERVYHCVRNLDYDDVVRIART